MSWGVKNTRFEAPRVSPGGPGVSIGGVRILSVVSKVVGHQIYTSPLSIAQDHDSIIYEWSSQESPFASKCIITLCLSTLYTIYIYTYIHIEYYMHLSLFLWELHLSIQTIPNHSTKTLPFVGASTKLHMLQFVHSNPESVQIMVTPPRTNPD